jgi:ketosteroid isomerase-like protein
MGYEGEPTLIDSRGRLLAVVMPLLFCLGAWTGAAATDPVSSPTANQEEVGAQSLPSVALPPELDRVLRDYESAWRGKDPEGLAALFTEDGFVLSSGRPPVRGREAIADRYQNSGGPLALRALAFDTEGTTGYIIGAYGRAKGEPDAGKFTLVLRRVEGRWLIVSDMDNGNQR